ncbi:MAG: 3-mercaptopyruvate sulfurtransferase [Granulicella sp.]
MTPLVTPSWLTSQLNNPRTVILDATLPPVGVHPPVDTRANYLKQHLPHAVFFDIEEFSDHATSLPHMLPPADVLARDLSSLGISDQSSIIIYEQEGVFSAPRAWWMLRTFGASDVHILDGGLRAWIEGGFPTTSGPVALPSANFHANLDPTAIKNFAQIMKMIGGHAQILDARSAGRFSGAAPEPRPGLSSGHMPGATSVPFLDLTNQGRLKSPEELRALFSDKGIDIHQPITTTCGSGVTAAVIALALEIAGAAQVSLYDGSWAEYAQHPDAIIEKAS